MSTNALVGWGLAALVVIGIIWYATTPAKKKADLGTQTKIVMMHKAPSIVPA